MDLMKSQTHATMLVLTTLALTTALAGPAQTAPQQGAQQPMPHDMSKMGMSGMMNEPHHILAMAYTQNIRTFATALRTQAEGTGPLNAKFARAAVAEIDRSLDRIEEHHEAHVKTMSAEMRSQMAEMTKNMDKHHAMLDEAVSVLEKDVRADQPDAKQVAAHSADLLKHLDGMSKMQR